MLTSPRRATEAASPSTSAASKYLMAAVVRASRTAATATITRMHVKVASTSSAAAEEATAASASPASMACGWQRRLDRHCQSRRA